MNSNAVIAKHIAEECMELFAKLSKEAQLSLAASTRQGIAIAIGRGWLIGTASSVADLEDYRYALRQMIGGKIASPR